MLAVMFPSNLHKNIVQLDRQISLLEKECKNMEAESRKKYTKSEPKNCKSSRVSDLQSKSPKVRVCVKKNDELKRDKIIQPCSARIQSSSSVQSQCSKSWNDNSETYIGRKTRSYGGSNCLQTCTCQKVNQIQCNLKKDYKTRSSDCNEKHLPDLAGDENICVNKRDHVLHKEVLITNPGSTIEVTVTQKSKSKENSPVVKTINVESAIEKKKESCKCLTKGPKWSEILYLETAKNKKMHNENFAKSKTSTEVKDLVSSLKFDSGGEEHNFFGKYNNSDGRTKKPNFETPVKLSSEVISNKNIPESNKMQFEGSQCFLENNNGDKRKKLLNDRETFSKNSPSYLPSTDLPQKSKNNLTRGSSDTKIDFPKLQQNCEILIKEKDKLTEELAAKENTLKVMKKREEEYISLITSLKSSLEKLKKQAKEDSKALNEVNLVSAKLEEQKKISEAIKKSHNTLQGTFERISLENHKLQTQIKLLKLESQKHDVLLAGKDAEINRYKEDIKIFQRQLSDHIELLKSKSQGLDAEKMMESIVQQSQLFFRSDLNSVLGSSEKKDSSKPNVLLHSSPTSTKSSVLNLSWSQISSIHKRDQSKGESDFVVNLKEESKEKEFFQIFGDRTSSGSKSPEYPLIDKSSDKKGMKNSSSFTSCMSLRDVTESSESKSDAVLEKDQPTAEPDADKVALRRVKSNIDGILKNLKLKWSKEIFESSGGNSTIKDFLNDSQISSITQ